MIAITGLLQQVHQLCPGESQHYHLLLFQQGFLLQGCFNKFTNYVQDNLNIVSRIIITRMIAITGLLQQVHQLRPGESQHCHRHRCRRRRRPTARHHIRLLCVQGQ